MNSTQAMAALAREYGSTNPGSWNPYPQPFYDHISYPAAGTTELEFFAVGRGSADPVSGAQKTLEDTNLQVPRQLGANFLLLEALRCGVFLKPKARQVTAIATDASLIYATAVAMMPKLEELFQRGTLTIGIDSKTYLQIDRPFCKCPMGIGVELEHFGQQATGGGAVESVCWMQNNPDSANEFEFGEVPIWIGPRQLLSVKINWSDGLGPVFTNLVDGASPAIQLAVWLDGTMYKSSQ